MLGFGKKSAEGIPNPKVSEGTGVAEKIPGSHKDINPDSDFGKLVGYLEGENQLPKKFEGDPWEKVIDKPQ